MAPVESLSGQMFQRRTASVRGYAKVCDFPSGRIRWECQVVSKWEKKSIPEELFCGGGD